MEDQSSKLESKLGLKPDQKAYTLHAYSGYENTLKQSTPLLNILDISQTYDWLQAFYKDSSSLQNEISLLVKNLSKDGQLWISWPKKSSDLKSDLSDSVVREIGLDAGLVDVKVAAIDDTWSGLKFVYRSKDR